ncbi:hypothetical protein CN504_00110 [Bacillus anthracis]|uniref:hypothetical protein n=1 Tax=Bacillus tropicus TaxID=2026188 RepID=UPI000B0043FD|nr:MULTISPECIES: hypothetical protein [Terrabacteria group]PES89650.1 hypothetical protein CN504_00110 [Bacillus anthracis]UOK49541.1 hypothetical protein KU891_29325 [Bacillus tropicus]
MNNIEQLQTINELQDKVISFQDSQMSSIISAVTLFATIFAIIVSIATVYTVYLNAKARKQIKDAKSTLEATETQMKNVKKLHHDSSELLKNLEKKEKELDNRQEKTEEKLNELADMVNLYKELKHETDIKNNLSKTRMKLNRLESDYFRAMQKNLDTNVEFNTQCIEILTKFKQCEQETIQYGSPDRVIVKMLEEEMNELYLKVITYIKQKQPNFKTSDELLTPVK